VTPGPSRRTPSQSRSRATVDAIVEAAAQVFERHGYAAGTTNRIAERAGVSVGSLYQYFADKDAIVTAVTRAHLADGARVLAPLLAALADDPEPEPLLRDVLSAMVALHRDRPRLHRLLFEEAPLTAELRDEVLALEDAAAVAVAAWLGRRPDAPADPVLTAGLLVQAVEAWAHRFVLHPPQEADEAAFVAEAARLLAAGL
jgi:AcrR family transcriptional regulator